MKTTTEREDEIASVLVGPEKGSTPSPLTIATRLAVYVVDILERVENLERLESAGDESRDELETSLRESIDKLERELDRRVGNVEDDVQRVSNDVRALERGR